MTRTLGSRSYTIPAAVRKECAKALEQQAVYRRGGTPHAIALATTLSSGEPVNATTIVQLAAQHQLFDKLFHTQYPRTSSPAELRVRMLYADQLTQLSGVGVEELFSGIDPDDETGALVAGASFVPPAAVRDAAARAVRLEKAAKFSVPATVSLRARRLADGLPVTPDTVRVLSNFFDGSALRGDVVRDNDGLTYLAYGGDAGRSWVSSLISGDRSLSLKGWRQDDADHYPCTARITYGLYGGDAARKWAYAVVASSRLPLTAAASTDDDGKGETEPETSSDINEMLQRLSSSVVSLPGAPFTAPVFTSEGGYNDNEAGMMLDYASLFPAGPATSVLGAGAARGTAAPEGGNGDPDADADFDIPHQFMGALDGYCDTCGGVAYTLWHYANMFDAYADLVPYIEEELGISPAVDIEGDDEEEDDTALAASARSIHEEESAGFSAATTEWIRRRARLERATAALRASANARNGAHVLPEDFFVDDLTDGKVVNYYVTIVEPGISDDDSVDAQAMREAYKLSPQALDIEHMLDISDDPVLASTPGLSKIPYYGDDPHERPGIIDALHMCTSDEDELYTASGELNESWHTWSPKHHVWSPDAVPPSPLPLDEESAYATALAMAMALAEHKEHHDGQPRVHVMDINPTEWAMIDEAYAAAIAEVDALEEDTGVHFFAVMDDGNTGRLEVSDLYAKVYRDAGMCLKWNPEMHVWDEVGCPSSDGGEFGTQPEFVPGHPQYEISMEAARSIAEHAVARAHTFDTSANDSARGGTHAGFRSPPSTPPDIADAFMSVFWMAPSGITADGAEYTPEERSKNAAQQVRDATGRFTSAGSVVRTGTGRLGTVTGVNKEEGRLDITYPSGDKQTLRASDVERVTDKASVDAVSQPQSRLDLSGVRGEPRATHITPKATLPYLLKPMDAAAINKVVSSYHKYIESERNRKLKTYAAYDPTTSDVPPVYMALVDEQDRTAVLDLLALAPASATGSHPMVYVRTSGTWVPNEKLYQKLLSPAPPAVVTLNDEMYRDVLEQVDQFYKENSPAHVEPPVSTPPSPPKALSRLPLFNEYGEPMPLFAGGIPGIADTPEDELAAERLRRYWSHGPGAAKIRWGQPGDWDRCVRHLSKYMGTRAKGYCQNRHHDALGYYTATHAKRSRRGVRASGEQEDREETYLQLPSTVYRTVRSFAESISKAPFTVLVAAGTPSIVDAMTLPYVSPDITLRAGRRMLVAGEFSPVVLSVVEVSESNNWGVPRAALVQRKPGDIVLMVD